LCIATQERELLVREKGVLETILKNIVEQVTGMLDAERLSNEEVRKYLFSFLLGILPCARAYTHT